MSIVSSTSVEASCTNVRALALEKPEIADDSESEDRRDESMLGTTKRGPVVYFVFLWRIIWCLIDINFFFLRTSQQ